MKKLRLSIIIAAAFVVSCDSAEQVASYASDGLPSGEGSADENQDGLITSEEARVQLLRLNDIQMMPGLWRVKKRDSKDNKPYDYVFCITAQSSSDLIRSILLHDRLSFFSNLPNENAEFTRLAVGDSAFSVAVVANEGGQSGSMILNGEYSNSAFSSELVQTSEKFDKRVRSSIAERLGLCGPVEPNDPWPYEKWKTRRN